MVLYRIVTGTNYFDDGDENTIGELLSESLRIDLSAIPRHLEQLHAVLEQMLAIDPRQRGTMDTVRRRR